MLGPAVVRLLMRPVTSLEGEFVMGSKKSVSAVAYEIEITEEHIPVRGNAMASGDDAADRELEDEILARLDRGDLWAWCSVRVKAIAPDGSIGCSSWLGGCSYKDEADFRNDGGEGYFTDLCNEAAADLCRFEGSFRQGIQTKYCGPTNSRGARVKVWAQAGVKYIPWDHALNADENHRAAAKAFAAEWEWHGRWIGGALPDGTGYLFVNDTSK